MSQLKAYPEYKDSGVDWIGEIPCGWGVIKLKHLVSIITGNTPPKSNEDNYANGIYSWVKPDNFNIDYTISETTEKLSEKGVELARVIPENSALVCSIGTVGKVAVNKEPVTTNQQINSIVFDKNAWISDYGIYAAISAEEEFKRYANKVVISILNKTSQENIFMPLPSINEQKFIGNYIRVKTSEIDSLISDKERLIELLEEKRQAVITETVTKGLDPNVKMKDSGIEWIGDIPEHWDLIKLNYITELKNTKAPSETKLPYLGLENVSSKTGKIINFNKSSDITGESILFSENDVLFGKLRPYLSKCVVATMKGRCTSEFLVLKTKNKVFNNKYLQYLMLSDLFIETVNSSTYGAKMPRASWQFIRNIYLPFPQYREQIDIMKAIETKLKRIDETLDNISIQILRLKEYRESLIYEAVTGKIDVRDYITEQEEVY